MAQWRAHLFPDETSPQRWHTRRTCPYRTQTRPPPAADPPVGVALDRLRSPSVRCPRCADADSVLEATFHSSSPLSLRRAVGEVDALAQLIGEFDASPPSDGWVAWRSRLEDAGATVRMLGGAGGLAGPLAGQLHDRQSAFDAAAAAAGGASAGPVGYPTLVGLAPPPSGRPPDPAGRDAWLALWGWFGLAPAFVVAAESSAAHLARLASLAGWAAATVPAPPATTQILGAALRAWAVDLLDGAAPSARRLAAVCTAVARVAGSARS